MYFFCHLQVEVSVVLTPDPSHQLSSVRIISCGTTSHFARRKVGDKSSHVEYRDPKAWGLRAEAGLSALGIINSEKIRRPAANPR